MKYLKKFESMALIKKIWVVKTSTPEFEISLDKIGIPEDNQEIILFNVKYKMKQNRSKMKNAEYVIISYSPSHHTQFGWNNIEEKLFYIRNGYVKMKDIEITPKDIEQWKIENDANKFNL